MQDITLKVKKWFSALTPEYLSFFVLGVMVLLLPFFFIPSSLFPLQMSKALLVSIGVIVSLAFFLISVLRMGKIELPFHPIFISALSIPIIFLLSALVNKAFHISLIGNIGDIGTFSFILVMFLLLFLVSVSFQSKKRILLSYLFFFVGFAVIVLFQLFRFAWSSGALLVGSLNDVSVFFGATALLSLLTIELLALSKGWKITAYVIFVTSLLFTVLINAGVYAGSGSNMLLWILGIISVLVFVYITLCVPESHSTDRKISFNTIGMLLVMFVFMLPVGQNLETSISTFFNETSPQQLRPTLGTTFEIAKGALKADPILGAGPNRFLSQWTLFKPASVNANQFWYQDFSYGYGLLPTFLVTTGILGALGWLSFILLFLFLGYKVFSFGSLDPLSRYLAVSSFVLSIYLWIIAFVYIPSVVIVTLAFFFAGVFLAILLEQKIIATKAVRFSDFPKASFALVFGLVIVFIGSVALGYLIIQQSLSVVYFDKGMVAIGKNDLDGAESNILSAMSLESVDTYYRVFSALAINRINILSATAAKSKDKQVSASVKQQFATLKSRAEQSANYAVTLDPYNYQNYMAQAGVFETLIPFGIDKAYESAQTSYEHAVTLNPSNPSILLRLANLQITHKDLDKAQDYLTQALKEKPDYADALLLMMRADITKGNTADAILVVQRMAKLFPQDPGPYILLGSIKFSTQDYPGAIAAFETATEINPRSVSALFDLGSVYEKVGRTDDAIAQFEKAQALAPDNKDISTKLDSLSSSRSSTAVVTPSTTTATSTKSTIKTKKP